MIILFWIIISFVLAIYGGKRKIGFGVSLLVSLLLSPLIGFICVALSERIQNNKAKNNYNDFDINNYRQN